MWYRGCCCKADMKVEISQSDLDRGVPQHPTLSAVAFALRRALGIDPNSADHIFLAGYAVCFRDGTQSLPEQLIPWLRQYNRGRPVRPVTFYFEPGDALRRVTSLLAA